MSYRHRPWQDNPELPDDGDINELIDSTPDEDDRLHQYVEDMLTGPEPEEASPYSGNYYEDDGA